MKTMREATFYSLAALLEGPAHGYAILERVKQLSSGHVSLATGTLYAVLDRLVDEGLIQRTATEIVRGRARQYFEITEEGYRRGASSSAAHGARGRSRAKSKHVASCQVGHQKEIHRQTGT